jgi:trk system potassium uptake protein TrkA
LIAVTATDELNLYTCLIAKNAGAPRTIARVRNPEYTNDIPRLKDELKLSLAINPEQTCARELSRLLKNSGAIEIDSFAKGVVDITKIKIPENSPIANQKIVDSSNILKYGIRICLVEREHQCYIPNGDFVIRAGDLISFAGSSKATSKLLKKLGVTTNRNHNIIILGGSKIAYYLAKNLSEIGMGVKIIDNNINRCESLSEKLENAVVIHGNGMDQELLISEGIEHADAILTLMGSDEENILMSLFAKDINPKAKVITEITNLSFTKIIEKFNLDSIIHPKFLTGEYIVRYVRAMQNSMGSNVETLYRLSQGEAEALEFRVREEGMATGVPLSMLDLKSDLQIACINRQGNIIIPNGTDTIELNDTVIVVTKHKGLSDLKDILR